MNVTVDTEKCIMHSDSRLHKTERFVRDTKNLPGLDAMLSKLAETVVSHYSALTKGEARAAQDDCYIAETADGEHTFLFKFGSQICSEIALNDKDVVFFKYVGAYKQQSRNDRRFLLYPRMHKTFTVSVKRCKHRTAEGEFRKLYLMSNSDRVNFPLLDKQQLEIVTTEDQNMLVQGVAGSGKTNICIDKIIFSACREYSGKVLYTTFSRGLLVDTKNKVELFKHNLSDFVNDYEAGRVVFADSNHRAAVENKLGIWFSADDDERILDKIKRIIAFLDTQVDYFLLEDLYAKSVGRHFSVADENFFLSDYVGNLKNYHLAGNLERIKHISVEVVYKEIFGMIFGCCDPSNPQPIMSFPDYIENRKYSFSKSDCETIYTIALDYKKQLDKQGLIDNNGICRKLFERINALERYSLAVIDEVQDFTQLNLALIKSLTMKMFCVGDVLQMINPSYFSFAYLKRLMFEKDVTSVAELTNNYRNTKRIEQIIESLGELNIKQFGTHSFVLKGRSVDADVPTSAVYVEDSAFMDYVAMENFDNFTVVVSSVKKKEQVRKLLPKQEILTVSEIKGLERNAVIILDLLSDNAEKWAELARSVVNRKKADENSVYRYYFNLLYVGVSRARHHLYVAESKKIEQFTDFFAANFENLSAVDATCKLLSVVGKLSVTEDETYERIEQFLTLSQYDNARFATGKIEDEGERSLQLERIDVYEKYVKVGDYRTAGIKLWALGLFDDAKKQFNVCGDSALSELVDASLMGDSRKLSGDIVQYFPVLSENEAARGLILDVLKDELSALRSEQTSLNAKLKAKKEKTNGTK